MAEFRQKEPLEKGIINFQLPEIKTFKLVNGLKVLYVKKDTLPIMQMNFIVNAGSKFENKNASGLANLTAQLLDEGAGNFTGLELDEEFEFLGTDLSISTNHDHVFISITSLEGNFSRSLELYSLILQEPQFNADDFAREREKIISKISQLKSDPSYLASQNFDKILFTNTDYEHTVLGSEKALLNLKFGDAASFYKTNFSIENSALVITGSIEQDKLTDMLNNSLGNKKPENHIRKQPEFNYSPASGTFIYHKENAPQSEIRIGHITSGRNSEDFFAKTLMNSILGGQFTSRINLNLREDKGYTYGAHSNFSYRQNLSNLRISTAVQTENTVPAVKEIFKELQNIKKKIEPAELDFAKSNLIKTYPSKFETYSQITSNLSLLHIHNLPNNFFNTYINNIASVQLEEVIQAANSNIDENNIVVLIVGDKNKIAGELKTVLKSEPVVIN